MSIVRPIGAAAALVALLAASPTLSAQAASIDGTGNNLANPDWGAAHQPLLRLFAADYGDGLGTPAGADRPSTRAISNTVSLQAGDMPNANDVSSYVWQWGQFIDHDIDLSDTGAEAFPIPVPTGDPTFDPKADGGHTIAMNRSQSAADGGGVQQQINAITSWLDASMVYGSDIPRTLAMINADGSMRTTAGGFLPFNTPGLPNAPTSRDPSLYLGGDVRANEQLGLTAMHTLFVRDHNYWWQRAGSLGLNAYQRFQLARLIVRSEIQAITYNEFIPALLGPDALDPYTGYDDTVQPDVANEFSTAVYRIGHSMLPSELLLLDENGDELPGGSLPLREAFFSPQKLPPIGITPILRGLAAQPSQELDVFVRDDVRDFLFSNIERVGFDLAALNMQRGRDHGLPSYTAVRAELGLAAVNEFDDIPASAEVRAALEAAYDDVDQIDLWIGALAEDHVNGGLVGETAFLILKDQFERLRDGDRFFYKNLMNAHIISVIENQTLERVIVRGSDVQSGELQDNVFLLPEDD